MPDFLIIGAQKSGTTTLYADLAAQAGVHFSSDKEPNRLLDPEVVTTSGRRSYARLYARSGPEQLCGDASTNYAKLPDYPGVPDRAGTVLGEGTKVLYIVRDPVERTISHHHHDWVRGSCTLPIDEAVRHFPAYLNYSRYQMQLEPWLQVMGRENVLLIVFEEYVSDRATGIQRVADFLGIEADHASIQFDKAYNRTEGSVAVAGPIGRIVMSNVYRAIRPYIPSRIRAPLRDSLLPRGGPRPRTPSPATLEYLQQETLGDARWVCEFLTRRHPVWERYR